MTRLLLFDTTTERTYPLEVPDEFWSPDSSVDHGYIIESRRGGGGFVRIVRMTHPDGSSLLEALLTRVGNEIDEESANAIIVLLYERKLVTKNEAMLMKSAVAKNSLALPVSAKNILRAAVMRNMLAQVFRNLEEDSHK